MIPYSRQDIQESDVTSVLKVLQSDLLTQGPMVPKFEQIISEQCNVKHAVAVNSATSALHIALMALDVGDGDIVWTSPNTFVASSNAALYCGAKVDFVDIDPKTYNISIEEMANKLKRAKQTNKLPKVVIPVHFAGQPCDMQAIDEMAKRYGFKVIEDASHAIGGKYKGQPIGNCVHSDITVFSFHPVKIITTAEGGMALTNNDDLAVKLALYRSHGITRNPSLMTNTPDGPWYYQQVLLGYNYRMNDLQAALGISQTERLNDYIIRRHQIADRYNQELSELPVTLPKQEDYSHSAYHLYVIRLNLNAIYPLTHLKVFQYLLNHNILVNLHYIPVHTQPYYQSIGFNWGDFPNAEAYYHDAVSIPLYPKMSDNEQTQVIKILHKLFKK